MPWKLLYKQYIIRKFLVIIYTYNAVDIYFVHITSVEVSSTLGKCWNVQNFEEQM